MAALAADIDVFRTFSEIPITFVDLLKEYGTSPAGMSMKRTIPFIDPVIKKRVYKMVGDGPAPSSLTIPAEGDKTATVTVHAAGRYAYVQLRALPTLDRKTARHKPWCDYTFSIDIANKKKYIYRLVFSTEFKAEGELQLGRIGHVKLPEPTDDRWTVFSIDLPGVLAKLTNNRESAATYSHVCGVQFRPTMVLRGIFTSDRILNGDIFPTAMAFPIPTSTRFDLVYKVEWLPHEPDALAAALSMKGEMKPVIEQDTSTKSADLSTRALKVSSHAVPLGDASNLSGVLAGMPKKRDRTPSPSSTRRRSDLLVDSEASPRPLARQIPNPVPSSRPAESNRHSPTKEPTTPDTSKARSPSSQGHQSERHAHAELAVDARRHHVAEVANAVPHHQISADALEAAADAAVRRLSVASIVDIPVAAPAPATATSAPPSSARAPAPSTSSARASTVKPATGKPAPTKTAPKQAAKPKPPAAPRDTKRTAPSKQPSPATSPVRENTAALNVAMSPQKQTTAPAPDVEVVALEHLRAQLLTDHTKRGSTVEARKGVEHATSSISQLIGTPQVSGELVQWSADGNELIYPLNKAVVALSVHVDSPSDGAREGAALSWGHQRHFIGAHADDVTLVRVSPDGTHLLTGDNGRRPTLCVWNLLTAKIVTTIDAKLIGIHAGLATATTCFDPDGAFLLVAGTDEKARQCMVAIDFARMVADGAFSPTMVIARQISDFAIGKIAFSPFEAGKLVSCGNENARIWRIKRGHLPGVSVPLNEYARSVKFTDCAFEQLEVEELFALRSALHGNEDPATSLRHCRKPRVFFSTDQGTVVQVDYLSRAVLAVTRLHEASISRILAAQGVILTGSTDGYIRMWPTDFGEFFLEAAHEGQVQDLALSPDGVSIVIMTSSSACEATRRSSLSGEKTGVTATTTVITNEAHERAPTAFTRKPAATEENAAEALARQLVHSHGSLGVLHIPTQQYRTVMRGHSARLTTLAVRSAVPKTMPLNTEDLLFPTSPREPSWVDPSRRDPVRAMNVFNAAQNRVLQLLDDVIGKEVCTASFDGTLRVWQKALPSTTSSSTSSSWSQAVEFAIPGEVCTCVTFCPPFKPDALIQLLDLYGGFALRHDNSGSSLSMSSGSNGSTDIGEKSALRDAAMRHYDESVHFLCAGFGKGIVRIFHIPSASVVRQMQVHAAESAVTCVTFDNSGKRLYSVATDGAIISYDVEDSFKKLHSWRCKTPSLEDSMFADACMSLDGFGDVIAVSFVHSSSGARAKIHLLSTAKLTSIGCIDISPLKESDQQRLVAGAAAESAAMRGGATTAQSVADKIGSGNVVSLEFIDVERLAGNAERKHRDHELLVAGLDDWRVMSWFVTIATGAAVPAFSLLGAHSGQITSISSSCNAQLMFTAGAEGTVRLWSVPNLLKLNDVADAATVDALMQTQRVGFTAAHHCTFMADGQGVVVASADFDGFLEMSVTRSSVRDAEIAQRQCVTLNMGEWLQRLLPDAHPHVNVDQRSAGSATFDADTQVSSVPSSPSKSPARSAVTPYERPQPTPQRTITSPRQLDREFTSEEQQVTAPETANDVTVEALQAEYPMENPYERAPPSPLDVPTDETHLHDVSAYHGDVTDDLSEITEEEEAECSLPDTLVTKLRNALSTDAPHAPDDVNATAVIATAAGVEEASQRVQQFFEPVPLTLYHVSETLTTPVFVGVQGSAHGEILALATRRSIAVLPESGVLHLTAGIGVLTMFEPNSQQYMHPVYTPRLPPELIDSARELSVTLSQSKPVSMHSSCEKNVVMLLSSGLIQLWGWNEASQRLERRALLFPPNITPPQEKATTSFLRRRRDSSASGAAGRSFKTRDLTPVDVCFSTNGRFVAALYAESVVDGSINLVAGVWDLAHCLTQMKDGEPHVQYVMAHQNICSVPATALGVSSPCTTNIAWIGEPSFMVAVNRCMYVVTLAANTGQIDEPPGTNPTKHPSVKRSDQELAQANNHEGEQQYSSGPKLAGSGILNARRSSLASMAVLSADSGTEAAVVDGEGGGLADAASAISWVLVVALYDTSNIAFDFFSALTNAAPIVSGSKDIVTHPLLRDETKAGSEVARPARVAAVSNDGMLFLGGFELDLFGVYNKTKPNNKRALLRSTAPVFIPPQFPNSKQIAESEDAKVVLVLHCFSRDLGNLSYTPKKDGAPPPARFTHVSWLGSGPGAEEMLIGGDNGACSLFKLHDPVALKICGKDSTDAMAFDEPESKNPDAPSLYYVMQWEFGSSVVSACFSRTGDEGIAADSVGCVQFVCREIFAETRGYCNLPVQLRRSALKSPIKVIAGHAAAITDITGCRIRHGPLKAHAAALTGASSTGNTAFDASVLFTAGNLDATTRCWNTTVSFDRREDVASFAVKYDWRVKLDQLIALQTSTAQFPVAIAVLKDRGDKIRKHEGSGEKLAVGFNTGSIRVFSLAAVKEEFRVRAHSLLHKNVVYDKPADITSLCWVYITHKSRSTKKHGGASLHDTPCLISVDRSGAIFVTPCGKSRGSGSDDTGPTSYSWLSVLQEGRVELAEETASPGKTTIVASPDDPSCFLMYCETGRVTVWTLLPGAGGLEADTPRAVLICCLDALPRKYPEHLRRTHFSLAYVAENVAMKAHEALMAVEKPPKDALMSPEMQPMGAKRRTKQASNSKKKQPKRQPPTSLLTFDTAAATFAGFLSESPTYICVIMPVRTPTGFKQCAVVYNFGTNKVLRCTQPLPFQVGAMCVVHHRPAIHVAADASVVGPSPQQQRRFSLESSTKTSVSYGPTGSVGASTALRGVKDILLEDSSSEGSGSDSGADPETTVLTSVDSFGCIALGTCDSNQVVILSAAPESFCEIMSVSGACPAAISGLYADVLSQPSSDASATQARLRVFATSERGVYVWGL